MTITIPISNYEPIVVNRAGEENCVRLAFDGRFVDLTDREAENLIAALKALRPKTFVRMDG